MLINGWWEVVFPFRLTINALSARFLLCSLTPADDFLKKPRRVNTKLKAAFKESALITLSFLSE